MATARPKVAVIGAGPCGLAVLSAFARDPSVSDVQLTCFEKQDEWGGLWNYTWRTGIDHRGEAVHGSMYRFLWSNGPKECLEMADYSFDEHFGRAIPSFPPREVLQDYIMGRAKKYGVRKYIKFATAVRDVQFNAVTSKFDIVTERLADKTRVAEQFDYVICCTGHFSVPNVPTYPGVEAFPGRVMHSHDFRSAEEFTGRDVLIVGGSYSAEDIALQCYKYGAASVTISYRSAAMGFDWPKGMDERPILTHIEGSTVHFSDGSKKDFHAILFCTGYQHHFPFLADELKLRTHNRLYPPGMYLGVVSEANNRFMFVGMQDQFYTFSMFDVQAYIARDAILGRLPLPSAADQSKHSAEWVAQEEAATDPILQIDFQTAYVKELAAKVNYPPIDWDLIAAEFKEWEHHKTEGILSYRDKSFKSPVTGTMATVHHTTWLEAMDDSMACFMGAKL